MGDEYFATSGKLKLKGAALPSKGKRRRKEQQLKQLEQGLMHDLNAPPAAATGAAPSPPVEIVLPEDPRTEAEKKFEEVQRKRVRC